VKILYIAGSGRTGSTLLGQLLGQIDGFFSIGEARNLWQRGLIEGRKCGCGRSVRDCPSWSAIIDRAFGSVDAVGASRLSALAGRRDRARSIPPLLMRRRAATSPAIDEYARALTSLYGAIRGETTCRVIVDSSKSPVYAEQLDLIAGARVCVVHLIRDPRATAYSWLRKKALPDFDDERLMARQSPLTSARRWFKAQILTELLWRRRAARYLLVRYEDLVQRPADTLMRICALIGEDPGRLPLTGRTRARLEKTHSVSGNPNRFLNGTVELRLDDEWVTSMQAKDRRIVSAVTWPLLLRYGYSIRLKANEGKPFADRSALPSSARASRDVD
jgi:Sulfotransferase family